MAHETHHTSHKIKRRSSAPGTQVYEISVAFPRAETPRLTLDGDKADVSKTLRIRRAKKAMDQFEEISPFPHCMLPPHFFERYNQEEQ